VSRFKYLSTAIVLSFTIVGCGSASQPVAVPGAGDATIPRSALHAARQQWPDAELGLAVSAPCPTAAAPSVPLGRGDLNGDGTEDLVVWLTEGGTSRLVALLARTGGEFSAVEVGELAAATSQLEVARRSTTYRLRGLTVDGFFGLDTIVLRGCDGAGTAWFWTGSRFDAQPIAN
jgi:hypothetical protein